MTDCPVITYFVSYKLINFDMCQEEGDATWMIQEETDVEADLSHLAPNSIYAVNVGTSKVLNGLHDGGALTIETRETGR